MRILIKGGVWKNTEDEILKAAVMKYGKNQWARVASLLNRKSAKQCKARWYEWLDPSIKKIEWSREEEEKLLHLAKLMPNQWRTIAPIVGRTAGQCMEHYERLLDQAQENANALSSSSSSSSTLTGGMGEIGGVDDPRRLRPGEIDPAPETKAARPDPIDMDEDEKEMLAEARARLANTKGKKAKRKARERQMEESRRLSSVQKRRELKAAGIESKRGGEGLKGNKKRKYIDYAREIPFQKIPPAGFYDVDSENQLALQNKKSVDFNKHMKSIAEMDGRHEKEEEEREQQKDKKRLKVLFKMNAPEAIAKIAEQSDPTSLRRRLPLSLPTPQVSDHELEDIVKTAAAQQQQSSTAATSLMLPPAPLSAGARVGGSHSSARATQALLGDYSSTFRSVTAPTPMRTPQQENIIMQEAHNQLVMRNINSMASAMNGDTGEDDEEDEEGEGGIRTTRGMMPELYEGTGFEGINPRSAKLATPNILTGGATPMIGSGSSVNNTPMISAGGRSVKGSGSSVSRVSRRSGTGSMMMSAGNMALRDQLGLNNRNNNSDNSSVAMTSASSSVLNNVNSAHDNNNDDNEDDAYSVSDVSSVMGGGGGGDGMSVSNLSFNSSSQYNHHRIREKERKLALTRQFNSLPEPEYLYEIALPPSSTTGAEGEDEEEGDITRDTTTGSYAQGKGVMDTTELEERQRQQELEYELIQESRKSSVLKRGDYLPRPPADFDSDKFLTLISGSDDSSGNIALTPEHLIAREMIALLHHDATMYPTTNNHKNNNNNNQNDSQLSFIPDDLMTAARAEVMKEYNSNNSDNNNDTANVISSQLWEEVHKPYMYLPQDEYQCYQHQSVLSNNNNNKEMLLEALMTHFAALRAKVDKDAKRASKLESRIETLTRGYAIRAKSLETSLYTQFARYESLLTDLASFESLQRMEEGGLQRRLALTRRETLTAEALEASQQQRYAELMKLVQSSSSSKTIALSLV